ncbi:MAG: HNH endonuclease [Lachnospiraceae bacterium]|nr:HNH endonuclease [Lachnospiraceae bacterium]
MGSRDFSDSTKLEVIKNNLSKNGGNILCEACGKKMSSIEDCHFDHIFPFAKGGKSTADNCQILCSSCNLKKNDKLLQEFMIAEKARAFLSGMSIDDNNFDNNTKIDPEDEISTIPQTEVNQNPMTKEVFDNIIRSFIEKHGTIQKIDFARDYNNLPSFGYVKQFYGGLLELKDAFGIRDQSFYWDRESIKEALVSFVEKNGTLTQKDLRKSNGLPSIPCILRYYPEYESLTDIQRNLLGLDGVTFWDKESAIDAGKMFMETHNSIHQKDFKAKNNLPTYNVILKLFGSLNAFQKEIGAPISTRNEFISKDDIHLEVEKYFAGKDRIIENQVNFEKDFSIKLDIIRKRYGSFDAFCKEERITLSKKKIFKYSKREVDDAISNWVLQGNEIPRVHDLTKVGLPSQAVIMRFYKDWREPFVMYQKLHEEVNRVK